MFKWLWTAKGGDSTQATKTKAMKEFWTDTSAVTPAEYALLAAFVSLVTAGALALTGKSLAGAIERIVANLSDGASAAKDTPGF